MLRKRYLPKVNLRKRFVSDQMAKYTTEPLTLDVNVVFVVAALDSRRQNRASPSTGFLESQQGYWTLLYCFLPIRAIPVISFTKRWDTYAQD